MLFLWRLISEAVVEWVRITSEAGASDLEIANLALVHSKAPRVASQEVFDPSCVLDNEPALHHP